MTMQGGPFVTLYSWLKLLHSIMAGDWYINPLTERNFSQAHCPFSQATIYLEELHSDN